MVPIQSTRSLQRIFWAMYVVLYQVITKGLNIFIIQTPSRSDLRLRFKTIVRSRAWLERLASGPRITNQSSWCHRDHANGTNYYIRVLHHQPQQGSFTFDPFNSAKWPRSNLIIVACKALKCYIHLFYCLHYSSYADQ